MGGGGEALISAGERDDASVSSKLALSTDALSFDYGGQPALRQVSLEVPTGRFVALLGANGAGKTTLFSIVTGLYSARSGSVSIMGHDLRRQMLSALATMGVVFQRTTLDMDLSVMQNLRYAAALQGMKRPLATSRIAAALSRHDLEALASRKVASLSGGQRRRVELARALLHEPALLLLDEPTVGLDMHSRADFVAHVRTLNAEQGVGVLWSTHLLDEIDTTDRICVLQRGSVLASGEIAALLARHGAADIPALYRTLADKAEP